MTPRKKAVSDSGGMAAEPRAAAGAAASDEPTPTGAAADGPTPEELIGKIVVFHLGGQRYALPIASVQEIQQIVAFADIPSQGGPVVGLVNLRGLVIPALDMRGLIGLPAQEYGLETPMVICRTNDQLVALIVDEVEDVLELPAGCLQPPPRMHALGPKMIGVCRMDTELISLLDVDKLLGPIDLAM